MRIGFTAGLMLILMFGVMTPMPGGEVGVLSTHDKFTHELAYGGMAVVGLLAGFPPLALSLGLATHGGAVELLQALTHVRTGDWLDFLADVVGVAVVMLGRAMVMRFLKS